MALLLAGRRRSSARLLLLPLAGAVRRRFATRLAGSEALPEAVVDRRLQFDVDRHRYSWRGRPCISVTALVASLFPKFDADAVIQQHYGHWQQDPDNKYYDLEPHAIKMLWSMKSVVAIREGNLLHSYIESFFKATKVDKGRVGNVVVEQFHAFYDQFGPFLRFNSERRIVHPGLFLAGTVDFLATGSHPNSLVVLDWKRSGKDFAANPGRKFSTVEGLEHVPDTSLSKFSLQLNLYRYILESVYGRSVESMSLVQFSDELPQQGFIVTKVGDMQHEVQLIIDLRRRNKL